MTHEVLIQVMQLRKKAQRYRQKTATMLKCQQHELPAKLFGMIFNMLTLGLELLSYYNTIWSKKSQTNCTSVEEAKKQNAERVIMIQKMIFLNTLSSIEFCFKEYIEKFPPKIGERKNQHGRAYLLNIVKESEKNHIINYATFTGWRGMIYLRNNLVHNNGVAEKTESYTYPNCTLSLESGKMTIGDLKLFPHLIDWLLDSSYEWILKMNTK